MRRSLLLVHEKVPFFSEALLLFRRESRRCHDGAFFREKVPFFREMKLYYFRENIVLLFVRRSLLHEGGASLALSFMKRLLLSRGFLFFCEKVIFFSSKVQSFHVKFLFVARCSFS